MDVKLLHFKCQSVVRKAYHDFKYNIDNAIFNVDDSIIDIELKTMKQNIGAKMNQWASDCDLSKKQFEYMQQVIRYYLTIATKKALQFGDQFYIKK